MSDSNLDAYMQLMHNGKVVKGESTDKQYGERGSIPILSFALTFSGMTVSDDDDDDDDDESSGDKDAEKIIARTRDQMRFGHSNKIEIAKKDAKALFSTLGTKRGKKAAKRKLSPCSFSIDKYVDTASCQLFQLYCANAQRTKSSEGTGQADKDALIETAKITFRKGGAPVTTGVIPKFAVIYFGGLLVTGYSVSMDPEDAPKEKVTLSFAQCEISYDIQQDTGRMKSNRTMFGWDFMNPADWSHGGE